MTMSRKEIDALWSIATNQAIDANECQTRYKFAELVESEANAKANTEWRNLCKHLVGAEREACAQVADSISEDQWALYKRRPPYTGQEVERASDYTHGKSDGAEVCAAAIRARYNA